MSDANGTCDYVLDSDDPETWGGEEGDECYVDEEVLNENRVWKCPHDAEDGGDLCIFHLPIEEKDDEAVVNAFLETIYDANTSENPDTQERMLQFLSAKFGEFDLRASPPDVTIEGTSLILSYSEINGSAMWSNSVFNMPVYFLGTTFAGEVDFSDIEFGDETYFSDAKFKSSANFRQGDFCGEANFLGAKFDGKANFSSAKFDGRALLDDTGFSGEANFSSVEFGGGVSFSRARFDSEASFSIAEFSGDAFFWRAYFDEVEFSGKVSFSNANFDKANFSGTEFDGEANFSGTEFDGEANFSGTEFDGEATFLTAKFSGATFGEGEFGGEANFYQAQFSGEAYFGGVEFRDEARFSGVEFRDEAHFASTRFGGQASFSETIFDGEADFKNVECVAFISFEETDFNEGPDFTDAILRNGSFEEARVENADFNRANLSGINFERAKLSNSDLFGTDLSGAQAYGARVGDVAINTETVFDKHNEYRCIYDPNSEYEYNPNNGEKVGQLRKAMGAYHLFEQLARANTLPDEQAKFFVRRQDMRRAQLREDEEYLKYAFAEAQNAVFRHGESFSRVVGWSAGTIVAFAFIFPLDGWLQSDSTGTLTYRAIVESPELIWQSFYHSTLLFLTGGGPLTPTGFIGEVLTTIEALIAPILLALLVFVLGRRAAR